MNKESPNSRKELGVSKLVGIARGLRESLDDKVSLPMAIAMSIRDASGLTFSGGQTAKAEAIYRVAESATGELFRFFIVGGVLLSALVGSLENGAVEGWRDELFLDEFNLAIIDFPIELPTVTMPKEPLEDIDLRLSRETDSIRQILYKDKSFAGFFELNDQGKWDKLPRIIQVFLEQNPFWKESLETVLPLFEDACKKGIKDLGIR